MTTTLLILAGGASSRMKKSAAVDGLSNADIQAANSKSKALITYGNEQRPILDALLSNAKKAGFKEVYLIVGEQSEDFKNFYGKETRNNSFRGLSLSYATQYVPAHREKPFGTADAVTQALEQYPELQQQSFVICNCDNLYSVAALRALVHTSAPNAFVSYDRDGLKFSQERISRFALVRLDAENYVEDIIEKPSEDMMETYRDAEGKFRVSMNIFKFDGRLMYTYVKDCPIHPERDEKELPTAIRNFCYAQPKKFIGIPFHEHVPDLTSKEDIQVFKKYLENSSKK